jgi:hypothetical protein
MSITLKRRSFHAPDQREEDGRRLHCLRIRSGDLWDRDGIMKQCPQQRLLLIPETHQLNSWGKVERSFVPRGEKHKAAINSLRLFLKIQGTNRNPGEVFGKDDISGNSAFEKNDIRDNSVFQPLVKMFKIK